MAENTLLKGSQNTEDNSHSKSDSKRIDSTLSEYKGSEEKAKKHKKSLLDNFRKKFSLHKKGKSKELSVNNTNNTLAKTNETIKSSETKVDEVNSSKSDNSISAIRRSFGKGKGKENSSNKDVSNIDLPKSKESLSQNQDRPQSMHIANSHPPRNGFMASFGWYWGPLSRSEATHLLRHQDDGSFLVRDSEGDANKFTLSFKGARQIFHNRILHHQDKYAFLPDEEFDSIPDLINDAMRRSVTSAYCFSRSTDSTHCYQAQNTSNGHNPPDVTASNNDTTGTIHHKHEVRLLKPISRFVDNPRSLKYLCRFMIRQYTKYQDLCRLNVTPDMIVYLEESKYNL